MAAAAVEGKGDSGQGSGGGRENRRNVHCGGFHIWLGKDLKRVVRNPATEA